MKRDQITTITTTTASSREIICKMHKKCVPIFLCLRSHVATDNEIEKLQSHIFDGTEKEATNGDKLNQFRIILLLYASALFICIHIQCGFCSRHIKTTQYTASCIDTSKNVFVLICFVLLDMMMMLLLLFIS